MDRIKSAFEKAMEKAEKLGSATQEERLEWKWGPEGKKLAADYLKGKVDLKVQLARFEEAQRKYVLQGVREVLAANILLPRNEDMRKSTDKALEGLKGLPQHKRELQEIASRVQYVVTQYLQHGVEQKRQAYQELKEAVEDTLRQQNKLPANVQVNVESLPEFQQEWLRTSSELDGPYETHLGTFRKQILGLR